MLRYVYLFRTLDFVDTLLHALLNSGKKHFIKNSIFIIKQITTLCLVIHFLACIWIFIGKNDTGDGVSSDVLSWYQTEILRLDGMGAPEWMKERSLYSTAVYFIVTTSTSVGYGDIYANTKYERTYLILLEFFGILVFANLQGIYPQIIFMPKLKDIVENKVNDIKAYL